MLSKHFGARLKYLRKVRNLTQAQLAQGADIAVPYLSRIERGLSSPSFEVIQKLSTTLKTEPANLFLAPRHGTTAPQGQANRGSPPDRPSLFSCNSWSRFGALSRELPDGEEHWSQEFWQLLGYTGHNDNTSCTELFLRHVLDEHRRHVANALDHALQGNPVTDLEFMIRRGDGEIRDIVLHIGVVKDGRGRPRSLHGTAVDVTEWRQLQDMLQINLRELETYVQGRTQTLSRTIADLEREMLRRKEAEEALRDLSGLMRGLADNLPDLLWAKDLQGRFLFVNQAICDVLLKARDTLEPLGKTDLYFAKRERAAGHVHTFGEICVDSDSVTLGTGKPGRFLEDGLVRGEYLALDVHKAPFYDAQGRLIGTVGAGRDVTADLAARKAQERSEAMLKEAQRIANMGSWENDLITGAVVWSEQIFRILGHEPGAIKASHEVFRQHLHPDDKERVLAESDSSGASEMPGTLEYRIVRADGAVRHVQARSEVTLDHAGRPVRSHGTLQDITERKRVDQRLQLHTKRLEVLHAMSQLADSDEHVITDMALEALVALTRSAVGYIYFMNQEETELTLYSWSANVMKQCTVRDIQTSSTVSATGLWGEAVRQRKPVITNDYATSPCRSGSPEGHLPITRHLGVPVIQGDRIVALAGVANKAEHYGDDDVRIIQLVMNGMWSVIRRKRSEQALHESEERLAAILGAMPDLLSIVDRQRIIVWANNACFETFGQDIMGRHCFEVFNSGKGKPCPDCVALMTFQDGRTNSMERTLIMPDGSRRFYSWSSTVLARDADNFVAQVLHVGRDITDFRQAMAELEQARAEAEAATKAKTHFLAAMSHDIRTPLNGTLGMLQLLKMSILDREQTEYLDNAITASRNLLTLVNEILDLAKVEAGRVEVLEHEFAPKAFLETELRVLKTQAELKGLRFVLEVDDKVPVAVVTDQIRLGQILQNLVGNAVKFTKQGELRVSLDTLSREASDDSLLLRFCVADTGPGISDNLRGRLFQPFVQGQRHQSGAKGSGLGLSIVKRLVELLGGTIVVHSVPGKGARFTFTIRASLPAQAMRRSTVATEADTVSGGQEQPPRKQCQILLVEDDDINRMATERMLRSLGYAVLSVANGTRALEVLREHDVDLVLMDVQLPYLDGLSITQSIRSGVELKGSENVPIVALTALAMNGDRERCLEAGMDEYLAKPVELPALRETLKRFLEPGTKKAPRTEQSSRPEELAED